MCQPPGQALKEDLPPTTPPSSAPTETRHPHGTPVANRPGGRRAEAHRRNCRGLIKHFSFLQQVKPCTPTTPPSANTRRRNHFDLNQTLSDSLAKKAGVESNREETEGWLWLTLDGSEPHALDIEVLQDVKHLNQVNTAGRAWSAANDLVPAVRT